jgi:hypothetical protein
MASLPLPVETGSTIQEKVWTTDFMLFPIRELSACKKLASATRPSLSKGGSKPQIAFAAFELPEWRWWR